MWSYKVKRVLCDSLNEAIHLVHRGDFYTRNLFRFMKDSISKHTPSIHGTTTLEALKSAHNFLYLNLGEVRICIGIVLESDQHGRRDYLVDQFIISVKRKIIYTSDNYMNASSPAFLKFEDAILNVLDATLNKNDGH